MDKPFHFRIVDCGKEFIIENTKAKDFDNYHTHLTKKKKKKNMGRHDQQCWEILIDLICKKKVPKSHYFQESAKRISRDEKYIRAINHKQMKDNNRQSYHNVGNF